MSNCDKCRCTHEIKANSYSLTTKELNIYTSFNDTCVKNQKRYELLICAKLPSITQIVPVLVQFNGSMIPLLDKLGNRVMSDQIRSRRKYLCAYGDNLGHLILLCPICTSVFDASNSIYNVESSKNKNDKDDDEDDCKVTEISSNALVISDKSKSIFKK